ncbi:GspE/PulE family protein [Paraburkholderia caballeronis]|uniref:Type IV pilus assembly protein PilB n=1 Tax=Paraburkholderia caballeronis TaxID=416943 RepID=A0A1H7Q1L9_9BURK|nr:ATPase, T2SS/T4P/T4SS family [Paraburkholderia caballeronis]PXW24440.1 type IV pilus assembly protein PilB [Paraburkholderia caballeronis]PXX00222.1 type IV pilus assembly protein PilB [Paraburkholderia caballeronis]RAJ97351.1 type IV pilus assembly protein PilB [Paraburkholderia caballeronis]SEB62530.1 type IV pilus assembly protein PilB [Paraburkholderia caballeronis]SEL41604.1 type IV pilus assembly protein PilB [Paraburkholderia caballeronis]
MPAFSSRSPLLFPATVDDGEPGGSPLRPPAPAAAARATGFSPFDPGHAPPPAAQAENAPAVRLLTDTLREASLRNASDLHVEPFEHGWRIRLRIDGVLHEIARPPAHLRDAFVTRIKVLARMDIAERRVPQDGRLRLASGTTAKGPDDYRVSSLPTLFGEKLVLRRLEALPADLSLAALGLDDAQCGTVADAIRAPHGLVLVTGPTGSGKTLSLYCFLQMLNSESRNLCSVEDPAEIQLTGINQVNVRDKAGLTFAVALRAFLRQDPDVIMVGEIRDEETADVAVKAAQTGHLVLSTLHTNDAPAAIARLIDIGVEPYNLAAALRLVTAQRLVRRLCTVCRAPADDSAATLEALAHGEGASTGWRPYLPVGCDACHGIGYRGRVGIHEVMPVSDAMRELIVRKASAQEIARHARTERVGTLRDAALTRVRDGTTSVAEVLGATDA